MSHRPHRMHWALARVRSMGFATKGLWHLVRTEPNARVHLFASVLVIALGMMLRVGTQDWCWLIAAMGMVWAAEALNTALELLADAACPERHPLVGRAKDVAAGGVLLAAVGAVGIGLFVFVPRVTW